MICVSVKVNVTDIMIILATKDRGIKEIETKRYIYVVNNQTQADQIKNHDRN